MRQGKEWTGPGAAKAVKAKKGKKDEADAKAVILDGKGKKLRDEPNTGAKKKKKTSKED